MENHTEKPKIALMGIGDIKATPMRPISPIQSHYPKKKLITREWFMHHICTPCYWKDECRKKNALENCEHWVELETVSEPITIIPPGAN